MERVQDQNQYQKNAKMYAFNSDPALRHKSEQKQKKKHNTQVLNAANNVLYLLKVLFVCLLAFVFLFSISQVTCCYKGTLLMIQTTHLIKKG